MDHFFTSIKCYATFTSVIIPSFAITFPLRCQIGLKSHIIKPGSGTTDLDLETLHYKLSWDSNILSPTYHTIEFEATLILLKNVTTISIYNINEAVARAVANSKIANKMVITYFKELENIRLS
jgi:hypothetical protein